MCELIFAILILAALVAVPLLILGLVLKLALGLALIPIKLLGAFLHVGLSGLGLGLKVLLGFVAFIVGVFLLVVVAPLLPLLILVGFAWIVIRLFMLCFP